MVYRNRCISKQEIDRLELADRARIEAQITDARVASIDPERYRRLDFAGYANTLAWRRYVFGFLGDMRAKRVLDICCGYSMTPVMFALAGAQVVAVDVAQQALNLVMRVAHMHAVADRVQIHCGPAEDLPFPDADFDLVYGGAALHHLQLDRAGRELSRVLRRGGRAGFQDPLGHNLLLEFARDNLHYAAKHPQKATDKPLRVADIHTFGRHFTTYSWRGFDLLAMLPRVAPRVSKLRKHLEQIDHALFDAVPFLQRYARFAVIQATK